MAKRRATRTLKYQEIISLMEDSDDSVEDVTWKPSPKKVYKYSNTLRKTKKESVPYERPALNVQGLSFTTLLPITSLPTVTPAVYHFASLPSFASLPVEPMLPEPPPVEQATCVCPPVTPILPEHPPEEQATCACPPGAPIILELPPIEQATFASPPISPILPELPPIEQVTCASSPVAPILPELPPIEQATCASSPVAPILPELPPIEQATCASSPVAPILSELPPIDQATCASPPVAPVLPELPPVEQVTSASPVVPKIPSAVQDSLSAQSHEEPQTENPNRSRKRLKNIAAWKKNIRKRKRNEGKEYVSTKGKTMPAKILEIFNHECRYQCNTITENERKLIHSEYWKLGNWEAQTNFIRHCVQIEKPKRSMKKKKITTIIKLNSKRVCKDFFLKTLTISNRRFTNAAFSKTLVKGLPVYDNRGKHEPGNKTKEDKLKDVRDHINSFPKFRSHYSREDAPLKKYLSPELSVSKMYSIYKEKSVIENKQPVKEHIYRKVFNTEFNLGFYKLRSDTCNTCDRLENLYKSEENAEKKQSIKEEKENHLLEVERTRKTKQKDKEDDKVHLITFDLEKTLPTPYLQTNLVYYKRQFWTYNLGIHDCKTGDAHMYMWGENIASRGASEVASCLLKYITNIVPKDCKHLVAYSDSCGGQNRNQIICRLWMYVVAHTPIVTVDHKFMVSGHSYLENDADFSHIEKHKKKVNYIYVPEDWMNLVEKTRKKFKVHRMQQEDFISTEPVSKVLINRKIDSVKNKINWFNFRWMRFSKENPMVMYFKESLDVELPFRHINMAAKKGNIPKVLPKLRDTEIKIKHAKIKDLMDLQKFIPEVYHGFYNSLISDQNVNQPSTLTGRLRGRPRKDSVQETDEESILDYAFDE